MVTEEDILTELSEQLQQDYPAATVQYDPVLRSVVFEDGPTRIPMRLVQYPRKNPTTWMLHFAHPNGRTWIAAIYPFKWRKLITKLDNLLTQVRVMEAECSR